MAKKRGGRYPEAPTAGRTVGILAWDAQVKRLTLTLTSAPPQGMPTSWRLVAASGSPAGAHVLTFEAE